jgi:hypothetical protein
MSAPMLPDRELFEQLCSMRALYARRGERDTAVVMTVAEAIRHANRLMTMSRPSVNRAVRPGNELVQG